MKEQDLKEQDLLEKKIARDECIERLDVLDKVKKLFLIPELNIMTAHQVAEYYKVSLDTLRKCYKRNEDEINCDGTSVKSYRDFLIGHSVTLESNKGETIININGIVIKIPNRGIRCFSKRAVLRIGMLLRDSKIAQEVRTQLLNTFEHSTEKQRTQEICDEQKMVFDIGMAYINHDIEAFVVASKKYIDYQNRNIKKLQDDNRVLADGILEWEDRSKINYAIRYLALSANLGYSNAWNQLYKELKYKHHIGLKQRGDSPYLQHIKENEWPLVIQSFAAICERNKLSPSEIMERAKMI